MKKKRKMKKTKKTNSSTGIDALRKRIDALDADLVRLLNERTKIALDIGAFKKKTGNGK